MHQSVKFLVYYLLKLMKVIRAHVEEAQISLSVKSSMTDQACSKHHQLAQFQ